MTFLFLSGYLLLFMCCSDDLETAGDVSDTNLYSELKRDFEDWRGYSEEEKLSILTKPYYLGYIPRDLSLLGFVTGENDYFDYVKEIISLYRRKLVQEDMLRPASQLGSRHLWLRDQFGRDNMMLYESYIYTGYEAILELIEQQVSFWLKKVPREKHNGYLLFPYGISDDDSIISYEIDPNQNLEIASLFSYLYWENKSRFYKNELFREIAYNEVNSVIALQKKNGSLPIREYLPLVEDSNYGGYCGDMLYHLAQMWGEKKWIQSTIQIGEWLHSTFSKDHPWNTPNDGENYLNNRNWNSFNLIGRILPFYAAGISKNEILDWISFIEHTFPEEELNMGTRWYFYQSIPRSYLGTYPAHNNLKPYIFNDDVNNDVVRIRVVGEEIETVELFIYDGKGKNVFHQIYANSDSFIKKIQLPAGLYSYKIVARGNNNKENIVEDYLRTNGNALDFSFMLFDASNTFQVIASRIER